MTKHASPEIVTFGCRLNIHESEVIKAHMAGVAAGDVVVFNTCAVTQEAMRQARQAIRRLRRDRPSCTIVVTGCAAQISPSSFSDMPEVTHVVGNHEKMSPQTWKTLGGGGFELERVHVNDILKVRETASHLLEGFSEHTRAFVQIQNGCDHRCTFCVIPYGRGNARSVGVGEVLLQIETLVRNGYRDIVLTGVDLTSWGKDLPGAPQLGDLVQRILRQVPTLDRLRLSSLDSVEVDPVLLRAMAEEERLMPHFHLSLQAGDDLILKRMKRRHLRSDAISFCEKVRKLRPDVAFGADLIAGFPTETEAHFENSLRLVEECGLTFLHVFPFSPHPQTPASKMPQVPGAVVKERARRLRAAGAEALSRFLDGRVGSVAEVLFEKPGYGRTPHAVGVWVEGACVGEKRMVELMGVRGEEFLGKAV